MKDIVRQTDDKSMGLITAFLDLFTSLFIFTKNVYNTYIQYNHQTDETTFFYKMAWHIHMSSIQSSLLLSSYEENRHDKKKVVADFTDASEIVHATRTDKGARVS